MELFLLERMPSINEIIESAVTNNLGFNPNRKRPWEGEGTFDYIDCTEMSYKEARLIDPNSTNFPKLKTSNPDMMNLHWHLSSLENEAVY